MLDIKKHSNVPLYKHFNNCIIFSAIIIAMYRNGGKELDRKYGLDLYDSQARWYDPTLGRTTTMDPLAEKTPDISPYVWCGANPVRNIDPDGCDTLNLNNQGYINLKIKTEDDFDVILAENGSTMNVSKSFMKNQSERQVKDKEGNFYDTSCYESSEIETLNKVFEFLVLNTDVEWSRLSYINGCGMIGTSHKEKEDASAHAYIRKHIAESGMLMNFDHSHPISSNPSEADINLMIKFTRLSPRVKAKLYHKTHLDSPLPYNIDFDINSPIVFPELIIYNK